MERKGEIGCIAGRNALGRRTVAALLALLALSAAGSGAEMSGGASASARPGAATRCTVLAAVDAATLRLRCAGGEGVLALAGVQAPRPGAPADGGEPFGSEARAAVASWLVGRDVDADLARRTIELFGADVRTELLARGLVSCVDDALAGDVARAELRGAEHAAHAAGRGIWSYEAWRRYERDRAAPVELAAAVRHDDGESIGEAARRSGQASWEARKAAFEAALAVAARTHVSGAQAMPPPLPRRLAAVAPPSPPRRPRDAAKRRVPAAAASATTASRARRRSRTTQSSASRDRDDGPIRTCSPLGRELCLPPREPMPTLTLRRATSGGHRSGRGGAGVSP